MKSRLVVCALICTALLAFSHAAEPGAALHWYQIYFGEGTSADSFTGSSPLDSSMICAKIAKNEPIALENLRYFGVIPGNNDATLRWHRSQDPVEIRSRVFIIPRTISHFYEYASDPAELTAAGK